jgi:hypothetical protein
MRLSEEYVARRQIKVPMVIHNPVGSILLRSAGPERWDRPRWLILRYKWEHHAVRPGKYCIEIARPVHDGYKHEMFKQDTVIKYWHQFEDYLLNWIGNIDAQVVLGKQAVVLGAWELFVFTRDSWFATQNHECKRLLFESLDRQQTLEARHARYQDLIMWLSVQQPAVLRSWKYDVLARVDSYDERLAALVHSNEL